MLTMDEINQKFPDYVDVFDGDVHLRPGFVESDYKTFTDVIEEIRHLLNPTDAYFLSAWELWDIANSPMEDSRRKVVRFGFWLGYKEGSW